MVSQPLMPQHLSAEAVRENIYRKMSFAQKWEEAKRLQAVARALKTAGIKDLHPDWSEQEVANTVRKIFLYAVT